MLIFLFSRLASNCVVAKWRCFFFRLKIAAIPHGCGCEYARKTQFIQAICVTNGFKGTATH